MRLGEKAAVRTAKQRATRLATAKVFWASLSVIAQVGTETHAPFTQWETGYGNSVEAPTPVQANQCLCSRRGWERDFSRDFASLSHPHPLLSQRLAVVLSRGLWISFFCTASGYLACPEGAQGISSRYLKICSAQESPCFPVHTVQETSCLFWPACVTSWFPWFSMENWKRTAEFCCWVQHCCV